jgi:hypothetical protein
MDSAILIISSLAGLAVVEMRSPTGSIRSRSVLGGLHHVYERAA